MAEAFLRRRRRSRTKLAGYSVYLLYWYKSTNTDRSFPPQQNKAGGVLSLLALLVQKYKYGQKLSSAAEQSWRGAQFTCFTGTKVQMLTPEEPRQKLAGYSVYLLYWYKSTNADT